MTGHYHRNVPYRPQWASANWIASIVDGSRDATDDPLKNTFGFRSDEEYAFWARRTCGLACLDSILSYLGIDCPTRAVLVDETLACGGYVRKPDGVEGLFYRPFLDWVERRFGLRGRIFERTAAEDLHRLISPDTIALCSVSSELRDPSRPATRKGGHLVLVHGADARELHFHNPSGIAPYQADAVLSPEVFGRFFANRGLVLELDAGRAAPA